MIPKDWQPETMIGPDTIKKYRELVEQWVPDGGAILEIGSFHGGSIAALADIIQRKGLVVVACDMWDEAPNPAPGILTEEVWKQKREGMLEKFWENMKRNGLCQHIQVYDRKDGRIGLTATVDAIGRRINLIFIDGGHTYDAAKVDIAEAKELVVPGGLICGHDYGPDFPGVIQAVDEAFGPRPIDHATTLWSQTQ